MYHKNFCLQRSSKLRDNFHTSAKSGHFVQMENLLTLSFYPTPSSQITFVAYFGYSLIDKVFLHHLVSKISQKYKKSRVWGLIPLIQNLAFCYFFQLENLLTLSFILPHLLRLLLLFISGIAWSIRCFYTIWYQRFPKNKKSRV